MPTRHRRLSLAWRAALVVALGVAAVATVIGLVPGSGSRLSHPRVPWLLTGCALEIVALAGYAVLFHSVYGAPPHPVGRVRSTQISIGELGAFAVVPTGAGGPALRFWALRHGGVPWSVMLARSVVHGVIFNVPYVLAALVLGVAAAVGVGTLHASTAVALAPLGLVAATVVFGWAAVFAARRQSPHQPEETTRRIGRALVAAVPEGLRELPVALRRPLAPAGALAYWAGDCSVLVLAFHTARGSAPLAAVVLAYMLGQLGNALPLPGGVGGVEPITVGVLTASGTSLGLAAAAVIFYRLVSLGLQAVFGALAVATLVPAVGRERAGPPAP
jgi:uncharacterized membrane protein YbhN (UPF0104 family)